MNKIVENVTIYLKNGEREFYKAISLRKKGVCTGIIVNNSDSDFRFIEQEFIPHYQIQKIIFSDENGELKNINI